MNFPRLLTSSVRWLLTAALLLTPAAALLGKPATAGSSDPSSRVEDSARDYFTDVRLIDQEGREHRLYSDLMAGKVVVISAFFTDCQGVCPVTASNLKKIQNWLGPRLGEEVHLLSITVDPELDDLKTIQQYAKILGAREGWYFLSGEEENLKFALQRLGLAVENKESHSPLFLIGNLRTGMWKKAVGLASGEELVTIVNSVLEDELPTEPAASKRSGFQQGK
jgi:protein SCO1/2